MSEEENEDEIVGGGERERREHGRTLLAVGMGGVEVDFRPLTRRRFRRYRER